MESPLQLQGNLRTVLACVLSFLAAAISSAGGVGIVGGNALYVPILNAVAGLSLKTSTAFSAFMVTGGTLSSVLCTHFARGRPGPDDGQPLIDYDVAVVSQPCLLLGVSVGVACNVVFPEWLILALFSAFLSFATFKKYRGGMRRWRGETEAARRVLEGVSAGEGTEEPLIGREGGGGHGCHWVDLVVLITVWLCFFAMNLWRRRRPASQPCPAQNWSTSKDNVSDDDAYGSFLRLHVDGPVHKIILGVDGVTGALLYAAACFLASIVGLVVVEVAIIKKSGRVSVIVLVVAAFLVLSKVGIAYSGGVRIWTQYTSGQYMGFNLPC